MKVSNKKRIVHGVIKWVLEISREGNPPTFFKKGRVVSANAQCIRVAERSFEKDH